MANRRRRPFRSPGGWRDLMGHLLEEPFPWPFGLPFAPVSPALLDLYDEGDMLVAIVAVPGVAREDLNVEVTARMLTIRAKGRARRVGHPHRQIALPAEVDIGQVEAELAEGVLTVRMPKAGPRGSRRVPVKTIAA